jgi:predicted P-loop ATPase
LLCRERGRHPVRDFLNECFDQWDPLGPPRIDMMLRDYFGAPDTPFVRAVSRIVMVASCRRIFEPGAKFDYMTVLESPEGYNKSSGLTTLYGPEWFSDQTILGLDDKQLAETLRGRWCIECADLSGMRKAEVEKVKAQLSRFEDRTRPAYGRAVIDAPRSSVFWGTTNDPEYLRSQTGNRRFFPVPVGRIDIEGLKRDRVALWGEAMAAHRAGESIMLPEPLWAAAGIEQDRRTMGEPWVAEVANVTELARHYMEHRANDTEGMRLGVVYQDDGMAERVTSAFVLAKVIGIPPSHQTAEHGKRLGFAMRKLGWIGPHQYWIGGRNARGFERKLIGEREPWDC